MQCVLFYGRILSRAVANGVYNIGSSGGGAASSPLNNNSQQQSVSTNTSSSPCVTPKTPVANATNRLRLITAVSGFPKNPGSGRVRPGKFGDDAYFVAKHQMGDIIGVADGVGGWRAWGIDPGEFSATLMVSCERLVNSATFTSSGPSTLLTRAYAELENAKHHILGSSTACLVVVRGSSPRSDQPQASTTTTNSTTPPPPPPPTRPIVPTTASAASTTTTTTTAAAVGGILSSANIGDSGYLVVRDGEVVHRSQEQQHYFNTPFQLSLPPPGTSAHVLCDSPSSADSREFAVEAGDLLLVATDGVFDNLPVSYILQLLQPLQGTSELADLQSVANLIAQTARTHAFDEDFMSPFAINARQSGINTKGGKPDDITVVLATILG